VISLEIEVGTSLDYKSIPRTLFYVNGCAWMEREVAFIFLNNLSGYRNISFIDYVETCRDCKHHDNTTGSCVVGACPFLDPVISEINRVVTHELLHLCGCSKEQIGEVQCGLHPFKLCGRRLMMEKV
jgi:hypothetical protein